MFFLRGFFIIILRKVEDMPYNVLGVCRHIVNYSNKKNYNISNLKLQKLLYFVQAYFLAKKNRPCFNEEIQAWAFGPVVPEAYQEFKQYGGCNIPEVIDGRIGTESTLRLTA